MFATALFPCFTGAEPVCAKSAITLRKGAGANEPVTWRVARNMPLLRLEKKGGWSKVQDLEGDVHWVKSADVTNKIRCVVVKTNVASLRRRPSPNGELSDLKTVDRYTPLKRYENERDWLQVEDETGRRAWIHESQIWKPVTVNSFSF
ncbi:MAG: hypothetical protein HC902_02705 [Calothrix sp. SM1_5_4]|nr:hypothetical protein [Calothrix sp. SM1_5_4]